MNKPDEDKFFIEWEDYDADGKKLKSEPFYSDGKFFNRNHGSLHDIINYGQLNDKEILVLRMRLGT